MSTDRSAERNLDREAAIIINDLDSMLHRIEMLQANPRYTDAGTAVMAARTAVFDGRMAIHQADMNARFAKVKG